MDGLLGAMGGKGGGARYRDGQCEHQCSKLNFHDLVCSSHCVKRSIDQIASCSEQLKRSRQRDALKRSWADFQSAHLARAGMVGDEIREGRGRLASIGARLRKLGSNLIAHVARPAFGGVESDDP